VPTFVVSDLHLADKGPRDNFAYQGREERFYNFLKFVEVSASTLLILGDLFDWWLVPMGVAVAAYLPLIDRLAAMGATWLVGNHDAALVPLMGSALMPAHPLFQRCCRPFEQVIGGRKFTFLHGHEADPYCCDVNPGIGEITAIISGLLDDRNKSPVTRQGHAVADEFVGTLENALTLWRTLTFQHGRQQEMVDGVEKYRQDKQADVVVYGHTHEPGFIGNYHFNTGSWARQHDTYVVISDGGQASVWEWLGDKAIPYMTTLSPCR
jgi:UDP-2,3-diacylglucosamine pyrophosphatase LpxH